MRQHYPEQLKEFWNFRDKFTVVTDLLLKGHTLVILNPLIPKMLKVLHQGHSGTENNRIYDGVEAETRKSQASFRLFSLMRGLPSIRLK